MSPGLFKSVNDEMCLDIIYLIYMYKKGLVLNNLQQLICHEIKTMQKQTNQIEDTNSISAEE